ncbi:ABC transporter ATP-binding protein [Halalkalibacterium halodurans]|uniref:ABC transporter (ATP-binding protein) n=1 Tax=Halalkalibacterium halodurans (strain ATCC BAA-125 / DSM 18197 / FERM 7344 / JCM 9153 / C-125) TaxID=272558 RepID=Q9K639_HALH5|nr:ABC transporter ATP-binding protein [Halalkalibacterium halodurans]MED4079600.1 ABC transporter ATP-binding protein [Halalkalibacterium halodurans]MED4084123.1 ABC transporter ATP-binding protein [Halalkalibacterium halodurans]MED4104601.1 ABC transporter ATP-binding protein [Halalkalibacterium halodurans]MED4108329.1 ABC transporter ATP-binding protein [Halalkalibacterium halodurans]MED4123254.1 ABC transporter ATP-binding protein [Halalkalibacterium halodurans]
MEHVIEVKHLRKTFDGKEALKDVSFSIKRGETFGFLGPSGAGKTTTIKILTGQVRSFDGEVALFGKPVHRLKRKTFMSQIGVLTDNSGLYERLTVQDNLSMYCKLYSVPERRIHDVLAEVGLRDERAKIVSKLSKGMKQRVILARAMLHKPDLLFLDEPTSALDPASSHMIHDSLRRLNREGTTIFLTTHDMLEAEKICDRVAFLDQGKIRVMDTPEQLRLTYADSTITLLLKGGRREIVENNLDGANTISQVMKNGELLSIHSNEPTLGDVFLRVTGKELM